MYGSIFRMEVKRGKERELVAIFETWEKERKPKVPGVVASLVLKGDRTPGEFFGVAVFKDRASYVANANDPEQDNWYRQLRSLLNSDPHWHDGEYVLAQIS